MVRQKLQHWRSLKSLCAVSIWLALTAVAASNPSIVGATDFDSSHCKSAFTAGHYTSAAKSCRAEAEATLDTVKKSHLTGDAKADTLGIAAIQMQLASVAQSRNGIASDEAQAPNSLNEAKRLINSALKSCTSAKCRNSMQRGADRIESWIDSSS